jgi:hypothetical protein
MLRTIEHELLYGSGAHVGVLLGALIAGVLGVWLLLLRLSTKLIASKRLLVEVSGVALMTGLIAFALYILVVLASVWTSSEF